MDQFKSLFHRLFACRLRKSRLQRTAFVNLPADIITEIFVRLPMKSVLICRCVCKHWNTFISDPVFAKVLFTYTPTCTMIQHQHSRNYFHLVEYDLIEWHESRKKLVCFSLFHVKKPNRSSRRRKVIKLDPKIEIPFPDQIGRETDYFNVLSSCNGLLYLGYSSIDRDDSLVCNPITGEFIRLPKPPPILRPAFRMRSGFGFHPKTNQYKVIRILIKDNGVVVEMHIVGTSTWITIEVDYPNIFLFLLNYSIHLNGALHWIGSDDSRNTSIWAFNFDTERFQSFSMPTEADLDDTRRFTLFEFRGSLCFMHSDFDGGPTTMWMMERYGDGESWTLIFSISSIYQPSNVDHPLFRPLPPNSSIIASPHGCFVYYDRQSHEFNIFCTSCFYYKFSIRYVPTLIPLKDLIIGDNVEVQNIYSRDDPNTKMRF